jgi:hypothetical protein
MVRGLIAPLLFPKLALLKSYEVIYITKHIKKGRHQTILEYKETFRENDVPRFSQYMRGNHEKSF